MRQKQNASSSRRPAQLLLAQASPCRKWREKRSQIHPRGSTIMPMKSAQLTCPRSKSTNFATETSLEIRSGLGWFHPDLDPTSGESAHDAPLCRASAVV